ncbi:MAG: ribosomal protein L7/L12 [Pyrinomonadaceae bacterium]
MTRTFNCASCSAPLDFTGAVTQKCRHCGSTVIAPRDMFYAANPAPFDDLASLTGRAQKIAEVQRLIHAGQKIEAIKVFREAFGTGLKEAKDAVEAIERGESINISGLRVQSSKDPDIKIKVDAREIGKAAKNVGKVAAIIGGVIALGGLLLASIVAYFVFTSSRTTSATPVPSSPTASTPEAKAAESTPFSELLKFGGEGNGDGKFKDNRHVAVDGKGRIYSSDYSPMQVQVFDADGKFINRWKPDEGVNLYDLAADREGNLYVANDRGLFKFEGETGRMLAKDDRIQPRGLALTSDGKLIVIEGKSFSIIDKNLKLIKKIDNAAEQASSTFGFDKVAVDGEGTIYTLARNEKDVFKFSSDGKFLNRFPHSGNSANSIAADPVGRILVADTSSIKVFDANGQKLADLKAYQAFGLAFNSDGEMFLASRPYVVKYRIDLEQ